MKHAIRFVLGLALFTTLSCADRLAQMQEAMSGNWVLESRTLSDGTRLTPPAIEGYMQWIPLDSRKAHVSVWVQTQKNGTTPQRLDYATSLYEISTSAITRARHVLIRQGYRPSARTPMTVYPRVRKSKGKISIEKDAIVISHTADSGGPTRSDKAFTQTFKGNVMTASYTGTFTDTWRKQPSITVSSR